VPRVCLAGAGWQGQAGGPGRQRVHGLFFMGATVLVRRTRSELQRLDVRAKKGLGQHFLVDAEALGRIVAAADLAAADTVIEVGPGLGVLTRELATKAGNVIAIELDSNLASALEESLASYSNVAIINDDVLNVDPATALSLVGEGVAASYKVVANLPYYVASAVVRHFLEASPRPRLMVVTVQKEVAQQMVAPPGKMSLLSVGVQFYGRPTIVDYIPASGFHPRPKVDSAVVRIEVYDEPAVRVEDEKRFFEVVRAGFSRPRKQLHNSLAHGLGMSPSEAAALVEKAGLCKKRRAETLDLGEWARLHEVCGGKEC